MAKKYYAIRKGRKVGVFHTWVECKSYIDGFSGAIYKSFATLEEAKTFVNPEEEENIQHEEKDTITAYVDGSYSHDNKRYSYGCVLITYNNEIKELSGSDNSQEYVSMRNVAGELLGSMEAIKWAVDRQYKSIHIYYDYEGIEKWADGSWKANKVGTQEYVEFIKNYRNKIQIKFIKVLAHSGVKYNEMADHLAKLALGII